MRIAIDARKLRDGGIGTYIRNLLRELARRPGGHEYVALLAPEDRGAVEAMNAGTPLGAGAAAHGPVSEREARAGKYSLAEHWTVAREASRAGAALLHAPHYTLPLGWRGPAVVSIHDLIHVRHARFFRPGTALAARAIAGAAARRARLVLTGSTHSRDEIVALLSVPAGKVRVIPYGVSATLGRRDAAAAAAFRAARGLPGDCVLYVGARKPHKNLGVLIEALGRLAPGARPPLVLSGARWKADDPLAAAVRRAGIEGAVHFAGDLATEEELSLLYSGALLYAQPSLDEGFGLPPLEAMACATPVLASPAGALAETLGDAASYADPGSSEAWAGAIAALLDDSARREELARRGLLRAREFTWERTAGATRAAYEEAARGG